MLLRHQLCIALMIQPCQKASAIMPSKSMVKVHTSGAALIFCPPPSQFLPLQWHCILYLNGLSGFLYLL